MSIAPVSGVTLRRASGAGRIWRRRDDGAPHLSRIILPLAVPLVVVGDAVIIRRVRVMSWGRGRATCGAVRWGDARDGGAAFGMVGWRVMRDGGTITPCRHASWVVSDMVVPSVVVG
ncbi:hypothetical protein [Novacetimonas hansenii]|uniref:hypothetical protein n=1 Tax=Novacetimonas hansenii TaxID=436 RepID=UPI0011C0E3B3|nr:hypothetical protein [Novacetimonas hansenii]WEQ59988.1 hypothetical protein LV563_05605 [Novacetimonas hansenii]